MDGQADLGLRRTDMPIKLYILLSLGLINTVNSKNFALILFSRIALKEIYSTKKVKEIEFEGLCQMI